MDSATLALSMEADFEARIAALDTTLLSSIETESCREDHLSWLAIQREIRRQLSGYTYLEIGSHLGGSIQQHLLDPKCRTIYSVDKRPEEQPDDRGRNISYPGNSTALMLDNLATLAPDYVHKVRTFDLDTRELDCAAIAEPVDFCFIDGEHTESAALADFEFCLRVASPGGVIAFHDADIVLPAIDQALRNLHVSEVVHCAYMLGGSTFAILLGSSGRTRAKALPIRSHGMGRIRLQRVQARIQRVIKSWTRVVQSAQPREV
jgi:Methyltransferase domain